jgi:hypothetical protein
MLEYIEQLKNTNTREWNALPDWVREDLVSYVAHGYIEEGTTLYFALVNDFKKTICCAGDDVKPVFRELAISIINYLPGNCHGSKEIVKQWKGVLSEEVA